MKLRQMNEKLVKEMKQLSSSLDKSVEKSKGKGKSPADLHVDASIKGSSHK